MTGPDLRPDELAALPRLPVDADGPVFAEPWQAQAFAMAVQLHRQGVFTWTEWAAALSAELKSSGDDGTHYYEHWLKALEGLVMSRGLAGADALDHRKHAWEDAYRRTPHGKPVML
ncbi:MAG TPA: nitrile hydratase accessory protein [Phenylobacterium sp.]|nr:nitrile hydratase accessory protein [Phenylobacterium sp.]